MKRVVAQVEAEGPQPDEVRGDPLQFPFRVTHSDQEGLFRRALMWPNPTN